MVRRRPPPPTSSPANPSSKAKDYTTHREYQVQDELDELRNRGVAKFMNRHFTETSKQLAQEKAEADAALADLERRRAQTSEFVPSNGGELNPFDSLYVELQQKRADCRRKERETMLLYQRYKDKFQKSKSSASGSKIIEKKATPPVQEVDENFSDDELELIHQTPQKDPRNTVNLSIDETPEAAAPPPSSPPTAPMQDPPGVSPPIPEQEVLDSAVEEKKIPDLPDLKSKSMPSTVPEDKSVEQEPIEEMTEPELQQQQHEEEPQAASAVSTDSSMQDDTDDDAAVATESITEPVETPAPVMEAPQDEEEETAATPVLNSVSSESFSINRPTAEVIADFPPGATSDEDSDDDENRSVVSGLTTVNSALTRQVMDQLESEMEFFIKNETEAIQKLLDEEEEGGSGVNMSFGGSRLSSDASVACDKSVVASLKAEQMAEEMQKMLEQFAKDDKSSVASPTAPEDVENKDNASSAITQSLYPRKYKSPNPNEEWMVYWDEKFEREYYFEKNNNKTQWEAPVMKLGFKDNPNYVPKEMPKRTTKLIVEKRLSRSDVYRKKLRKRRMQKAIAVFVVLSSLLLSAVHWKTNHSEKSYPDAMRASYSDLKDLYEYTFTNRTAEEQEAAEIARRELERKEKEAKEAAERERKRKAAEAAKEAERLRLLEQKKAQEEAERKRKAAEEAEKKRILAAEKKAAEDKAAREKAAKEKRLREEEETRLRNEEEKRKAEEARLEAERLEAERLAKLQEELRRPWGCNLPFSHIANRRCRKLAKTNPIYSEDYLLNAFLQ